MDPFVVISFGKKIFRTRVIRHSLNPVWDEKLLFHVRRHENTFVTQFAVLDWDKVSVCEMLGKSSAKRVRCLGMMLLGLASYHCLSLLRMLRHLMGRRVCMVNRKMESMR
jgi:hypothetical protein